MPPVNCPTALHLLGLGQASLALSERLFDMPAVAQIVDHAASVMGRPRSPSRSGNNSAIAGVKCFRRSFSSITQDLACVMRMH